MAPELPADKTSRPVENSAALEKLLEEHAESLRERDERMRAILNTASDAILTIDARGLIQNMNPATEKLFGYTPDELVGQNVKILMPYPYCDAHDSYIARYLETREARIIGIGREVVARRKDGTIFPVSLAVSEVDHLNLFTGVIRDQTAVKELKRHILEIAAEEQRRIGQELHDGVAQELTGLSLYVRSLLNQINQLQGELSTLERDVGGKTTLQNMKEIALKLNWHLQEAHQHVRELSHGLMPVQLDAEGLRAALQELATSLSQSDLITCQLEYPPFDMNLDHTAATHLFRIAQEAVNNAVRHSHADRIEIRMKRFDGHFVLEIADNGRGMDPRHKSLERKDTAGLRTMHYRASQIGGHLQIDATPGGGTRVRCVFAAPKR